MTLDEIRQQFPDNGFALYAYTPGGDITAEMHWPDGSVLTAQGHDEDEALRNLIGLPSEPRQQEHNPQSSINEATDDNELPAPDVFG